MNEDFRVGLSIDILYKYILIYPIFLHYLPWTWSSMERGEYTQISEHLSEYHTHTHTQRQTDRERHTEREREAARSLFSRCSLKFISSVALSTADESPVDRREKTTENADAEYAVCVCTLLRNNARRMVSAGACSAHAAAAAAAWNAAAATTAVGADTLVFLTLSFALNNFQTFICCVRGSLIFTSIMTQNAGQHLPYVVRSGGWASTTGDPRR